jgi:choline dehydrogenase-like flavoprotein
MIELGKLFVSQNIGRIGVKDFLFSNEEFVHKAGYHHMGGTRIGFNKTDSVVDRNLKVHGVNNLYICGSSIFRKGGSANPTFTIVQLSLRLGEYLGSVT